VFKPVTILACGLALLAGCTTVPRDSTKPRRARSELPPDWELAPKETPARAPATSRQPADAVTFPVPATPPETEWLSLTHWSAERGYGVLRPLSVNPPESFAAPTTNGALIVTVGSQTAYWNGLALRLGFAPQMINDQPSIHTLDVRKTLEPLLRDLTVPDRGHRVVVLDPGHGGSNTGTRSVVDGRLEKELTLDWAFRLAALLEASGWRVYLTRTNDVDVSLADRVAFAEAQQADLFLSLHFNSSGVRESEQSGLETYCLTPAGMPSSLTRGYGDDATQAFPNNAHDEQNLQYALRLHRALLAVNGAADRGVRRARFLGVLRGQRRPAVLIEGGYLSNLEEARRIGDAEHRQKLAEAIANALE